VLASDTKAGAPAAVIAADKAAVTQASRSLASVRRQASSANSQAASQVAAAKLGVRSADLAYKGATSVDTTAAVEADRASVVQAEGAVRDAQDTLDLATIRAPIDGIVSSVDIRPGDIVSGTVIRLRSAAVEVTASVTESDLPRLKVGQPVDVVVAAIDADVTGSVQSLDLASPTTSASGVVSYDLVIELPSAPEHVAPGMTADVDVTTALAKGVVAVPASALGGEPGAYTVQVPTGPGQARTVPVEVGLLTAEYAEIRSGIDAGTEVVTGTVSAKDLVQQFPTGPGGGTSGAASPAARP
jgi:RND family efflux transporter MFP subunit